MSKPPVSRLTTNRLSVYLRCLTDLEQRGVRTISSRKFAEQFHLNSAQIRKDLATFGEFGVRGVGYGVRELKEHLVQILGLDREYRVVILGAGNLGLALAGYPGFNVEGFRVVALLDIDPARVERLREEGWAAFPAGELGRVVREERANMAILAVPASEGQGVLDQVSATGIRAVLNFCPVRLRVPEGVELATVDLKVRLEGLAYRLSRGGRREESGPDARGPLAKRKSSRRRKGKARS
jgi:redox-sensing transcriptional repressor